MNTTTIIFIIGAVFILLAIADSIIIQGNALDLINNKLRVPLGIIGMALIGLGIMQVLKTNPDQKEPPLISNPTDVIPPPEELQKKEVLETSIAYPKNGALIQCNEKVIGVYPDILENDIWVLSKPQDNRYYPQSDSNKPARKKNGKWEVICKFGGNKDENFELIVYETDQSSSDFFSQTIEKWNSNGKFTGLRYDEIPEGAKLIESILVTSEINCRGKN